ncbi:hypothetical protein CC80DRAFT_549918 [Byssothecium circinans]|uniref:N-acetyltransferase domain-containing protein n=1 Tax=Byssothecium circinans TaxID=147558 RepID=A0A6A5TSN8_9PLEO|nr:hypothetical protein CC80DRAFT_549918 [Byssothecium circinans]
MAQFARCSRDLMPDSSTPDSNEHTTWAGFALEQQTWQQQQEFQNNRHNRNMSSAPPTSGPSGPLALSSQANTHHRYQNRRTPQTQTATPKMAVPADAYIPPHMRNKNAKASKPSPPATSPGSKSQVPMPALIQSTEARSIAPETRPALLPTPPTTSTPVEKSSPANEAPKPQPVKAPRRNNNPREPKKPHRWPKNKEMKPLPSDEDDENGGVPYDNGWGDCESHSDGDPFYDVKKLLDWKGDWMPPPVDWSARNPFADHHLGESIEKWINGHDLSGCKEISNYLETPEFASFTIDGKTVSDVANIETNHKTGDVEERDTMNAAIVAQELARYENSKKHNATYVTMDIAPRSWIPSKIEGCAPRHFWRDYASRAPEALSDIDVREHNAYWDLYKEDKANCFIHTPVAPEVLLDPNDEESGNPNAHTSTTEFMERSKDGRARRARRQQRRREAPPPPFKPCPPRPELRPTSNIYLRPVQAADVEEITAIYNYYVENSISAAEFTPRTVDHLLARIDAVVSEELPYIVAVARGNGPSQAANAFMKERIVGFASIDDYCDKGSIYRYTFELELYTHPGYLRKGIAKCLMDRLLSFVSTGYPVKGGYDWVNRGEYLRKDAGRTVKTINVSVPHEENATIEWMHEFFKKFKFSKAGHLKKVGYKEGKVVDVMLYQHTTSEPIDPNQRPQMPL